MDLSALIFVALAVAWAVYLVPKAVRHHDEVAQSRSVDRFSRTMRVLARREATSSRDAQLVISPGRAGPATAVVTKESVSALRAAAEPAESAVRSGSARRLAVRRRRRVLGLLVTVLLAVGILAAAGLAGWWWVAVPATLLIAWLAICRVSVRAERRTRAAASAPVRPSAATTKEKVVVPEVGVALAGSTPEQSAALDGAREPREDSAQVAVVGSAKVADIESPIAAEKVVAPMWDPVPMTLPTYVEKERAQQRTVRTIDLDSTGVWTSGRSESDSALARGAEQAERAAKVEQQRREDDQRRATGS